MTSALLSIFLFSTWGLFLLSWVVVLGLKVQKDSQDLEMGKLEIQEQRFKITDSLISQIRGGMGVPVSGPGKISSSRLQELVNANRSHPEVSEIDSTDLIIGVRFEGEDYPPTVDDDENEDS